jgi:hypothetical protein
MERGLKMAQISGEKDCASASGTFQGQCHELGYFFEGLSILISTFCVCVDGFQGLSKAFHYPIQ